MASPDVKTLPLQPAHESHRPAVLYFLVTFAISWTGALALLAPRLLRGEPIPKFTGLMMFPIMLLGPGIAGIALTAATQGSMGLRMLRRRMSKFRIPLRWYSLLLLPSALVLTVLWFLSRTASPSFAPNRFVAGIAFGLIAGFLEETGWTGFAFPAMMRRQAPLTAAIQLGVLWSVWHIPALDYLGAATPHGRYLAAFFVVFLAAMTAIRVLICWACVHVDSVFFAQLLHAASTAALVIFSPHVTPGNECIWYAVYAALLWCVVAAVVAWNGRSLGRP